jgi:hypothetical protein
MDETTGDIQVPAEELDDVEGQMLKEVAIAATLAAGVGGAAGIANAAHTSPVPKAPIVQQVGGDSQQLAGDASQLTHDAVSGTMGITNQAVHDASTLAHQVAGPELQLAGNVISGTETLAGDVVSDTTSIAGNAVHTTTQLAGNVEATTFNVASGAEHTTFQTAGSAVNTADKVAQKATQDVQSVERTAIRVVSSTLDTLNKGWDLNLNVLGIGAQGGGNMLVHEGTVSVVKDGKTIATAAVNKDGSVQVRVGGVTAGTQLTLIYSGTQNLAPASLNITL